MIITGLILIAGAGAKALALGLVSLLWYNGVYTRLKKMTAFAAVPGAAVGMIPPAIGWAAAGGGLLDPRLSALCLVFFMWQVPHFWLLLLRRGEEYEQAGLPSLTAVMSRSQIARVTYIWIFAAAVSSLMLPLYGAVTAPVLCFALLPPAAWLIWSGRALAARRASVSPSPLLFRKINIYLFVVMTLLVFDNILSALP
jgi:protoheme IX farnesyltransferase